MGVSVFFFMVTCGAGTRSQEFLPARSPLTLLFTWYTIAPVMDNRGEHQEIIEAFVRVINTFSRLEKIPRDFGTGDVLYPSEIHMIDMIGKHRGINLTELAKRLGITKGAVPKMIRKLDGKGLIRKLDSERNRKEVFFALSGKGMTAFQGHRDYHRKMDRGIGDKLAALSDEERSFLFMVFRELERYGDQLTEDA